MTDPSPAASDTPRRRPMTRAQVAWCVYDWANSGFPTVIVTFVFSAYFAQAVAENSTLGTAQWGWALSISGITIALLSPVFGAIADRTGRRKPWLAVFTLLCAVATVLLWQTRPDPSWVMWALVCVVIANTAFEVATVFYNAMLPDIAPPERLGRISGWGWGMGYFGGLTCLVVALLAFVQTDTPMFGLDKETQEHVRAVGPLVGLWVLLFAMPLFLFTPDGKSSGIGAATAIREGIATLIGTLRRVRDYKNIARFLVARLLYVDGMNTMFAFGGIYAAGTFGMKIEEIILFGIALNVTAGLGAIAFAWIDDRIGSKRTVVIALCGLMALGIPLLLVEGKFWFWVVALPLGIFMGPAQAASRTLMARLAPEELRTEMFGLFAFSGKATAFLGPAILAWVTLQFESQRAGMATIIVFLAIGLAILIGVKERDK